jgi:hypothetical protein
VTTFDGLLSRIRQQTMGYAKDQSAVGELAAGMSATATTFTADTGTVTSLSRGLVEIDDELILVKSYDRTSGVVQVMGGLNGRGVEGTTAAPHNITSLITADPKFPRARVRETVNDVLQSLYPQVVVFGTTEITNVSVVYEYGMPAEALDVWAVSDQTVGPTQVWMQGLNYKFNPTADTSAFPTGKSIQLFDSVTPGMSMLIKYTKAPNPLVNGSDDFAATTGLPERFVDLVMWGACARLLPAYEAARLQQSTVESTERAALVPPQSAVKAAQYYLAMYQQRLEEERSRMFQENPQTISYAGA